jgi:hypothetical protein
VRRELLLLLLRTPSSPSPAQPSPAEALTTDSAAESASAGAVGASAGAVLARATVSTWSPPPLRRSALLSPAPNPPGRLDVVCCSPPREHPQHEWKVQGGTPAGWPGDGKCAVFPAASTSAIRDRSSASATCRHIARATSPHPKSVHQGATCVQRPSCGAQDSNTRAVRDATPTSDKGGMAREAAVGSPLASSRRAQSSALCKHLTTAPENFKGSSILRVPVGNLN